VFHRDLRLRDRSGALQALHEPLGVLPHIGRGAPLIR
jgi:hypothetical protein